MSQSQNNFDPPIPAAKLFEANVQAAKTLLDQLDPLREPLQQATEMVAEALLAGCKLLACGNGGSAADCAHLTAEIVGRFNLEREGFPAIDLTANHSAITSLMNDFDATQVFSRQVIALGQPGDVLIAITTSGNSENIRLALEAARQREMKIITLLGKTGGVCKGLADVEMIVPADTTARIQEIHLLLYHTLCEAIDPVLARAK